MAKAEVELQEKAEEPSVEQASELPDPDPQQAEALRLKAFRMVVKDCVEELTEVLDAVPERMWTKWQNKANKDLLTLAEERGSSSTYAFLSKRLGIAKERENHAFMVSQAVWVFLPGEVVPNQATVWEDSPAEQSTVKVQMWDDDSETFREFDKCMVHRMNDS
ncbi:unnamed protein product [Effrenium voratum]|uniref:Uncharacterized protein n=1 Tax=Effrenium voratum TaxID=2562239 RepID=A0AA36JJQ1_9DINO|nr:unnamed protein product [Effrenium voratum]